MGSLFSVNWSAPISQAAGTVTAGQCVVSDSSGLFYVATSTNRASFGHADGISVSSGDSKNPIIFIQVGPVDAAVTGLGTGAASWVRVSTAGVLERVTPSGSDDVVGWCETNGKLHALFGLLTAAIVNGSGGGGTFTPPTGTGLMTVTSGVMDAASLAFPLSAAKGGTGLSSLATNVATFLGTPSGANLAAALTSALPASKGGTGLTSLASGIATWFTTPSSANLLAALTTSTGTGSAVFGTSPTLDNPSVTTGLTLPTAGPITFGGAPGHPATAGVLRYQTGAQALLAQRNTTNTDDFSILETDASGILWIGGDAALTNTKTVPQINVSAEAGGVITLWVGAAGQVVYDGANANMRVPIIGYAAANSPYGVHGESSFDMNNTSVSLPAANYCYSVVKVTSTAAFTAGRTLTFPAPGSDAVSYSKFVRNTQAGAFAVTCTTGAGTTIAVAQGKGAWLLFDSTGVVRMTADV